tara:strand:- start:1906 stop:3399 length:1494 start_codon:yes stop_codon:yes gene_type:complete
MSTSDNIVRPVRLSRRSRQGIVLGLDGWQLSSLLAAFTCLFVALNQFGMPGVLYALPVVVPLAVAGVISIHGLSCPKIAGLWVLKHARHAIGATRTRFRPEAARLQGTINLPGRAGVVQLWETPTVGVAYHPHERTVSITAELEVQGFLMKDAGDRLDLSRQWASVLASFTQRPGIKRVTLQERTQPTTIRPARDTFESTARRRGVASDALPTVNYRDVLDIAEQFAVSHRNYLTLTFDLTVLGAQLRALGGGKDAILALATVEGGNVSAALRASKIAVRRWLNTREWAALGRAIFDPEFLTAMHNRTGDLAGVDPAAIGPMALEEPRGRNGIVYTDSGVHTTLWIHEWPRTDAPVGFLEPVVFARHPVSNDAVAHVFTVVLTPVPVHKALKRIRDEKRIWNGNQRMRARRGQDGSISDEADWLALEQQEEEIVSGHGEYRYGGYLTVTARDERTLEQAVAGARNALLQQGMEAQVLYCQQAEALLVSALPLGWGMK